MELFLNFILYILAAVGLSHILADGSIFSSFKFWLSEKDTWWSRPFLNMMNCYQCNGFWSGLVVFLIALASPWLNFLLWAFAISLVSPLFGYLKLYFAVLTSTDEEEEPNE